MRNYRKGREKGSVLIVSLVMLLLLSLIGVAGIQSTVMQDRMAANLLDKDLAFQATEAVLREGEDSLAAGVPISFPNSGGLYRSEEHTSELQSRPHLVCRLLLEKKKKKK